MICQNHEILEIVILLIIFLIYILNLLVQCNASSLQTQSLFLSFGKYLVMLIAYVTINYTWDFIYLIQITFFVISALINENIFFFYFQLTIYQLIIIMLFFVSIVDILKIRFIRMILINLLSKIFAVQIHCIFKLVIL